MSRRSFVPLVLLALLGVLALVFAYLGASAAPSGATLTVQSASVKTFGDPVGSNRFTLDLVATVQAGAGGRSLNNARQVAYAPPHHMAVSLVGNPNQAVLLTPTAITCALKTYTSLVGGTTPWTPSGTIYVRTETLAQYSSRVPAVTGSVCEPRPSTVQGTVHERVSVRSGYLVGMRLQIVVPQQKQSDGSPATAGNEQEAIILTQINGISTRTLATQSASSGG
ncbi:MAG TPA: hypothetical protein VHD39_02840 [Acidimicrobiales bacterium]|nr:hypothetical protein [Acidimicrobiales bacterium]